MVTLKPGGNTLQKSRYLLFLALCHLFLSRVNKTLELGNDSSGGSVLLFVEVWNFPMIGGIVFEGELLCGHDSKVYQVYHDYSF